MAYFYKVNTTLHSVYIKSTKEQTSEQLEKALCEQAILEPVDNIEIITEAQYNSRPTQST